MEPKNTTGIPLHYALPHQNTLVRFPDDTFVRHAFENLRLILESERKEHLYKEQFTAVSETPERV